MQRVFFKTSQDRRYREGNTLKVITPDQAGLMFNYHPATVRRAGRKRGTRFESSEALAEQPAVARSAVELHRCCTRVSRAAALVRQHIDGVARASSAGTKSGSSARSLVLLTMLAPVSRCARLEDQLQLDDEANSEIADRYTTGSSARHRVAVGDFRVRFVVKLLSCLGRQQQVQA